MQSPYIVIYGSPINREDIDLFCLSFDLSKLNKRGEMQLQEGREGRSSTEQGGSSTKTMIHKNARRGVD
jgi:hypothetical protein